MSNNVKQKPMNRMISHLGISNQSHQLLISVKAVTFASLILAAIFRNLMEIVCVISVLFGLKRTDGCMNIQINQQQIQIHFLLNSHPTSWRLKIEEVKNRLFRHKTLLDLINTHKDPLSNLILRLLVICTKIGNKIFKIS